MPYQSRADVLGAIQRNRRELWSKPGVIGLAPGKQRRRGEWVDHQGEALVAFVRWKPDRPDMLAAEDLVPPEIDGCTTDVIEMEPPEIQIQRQRHRPMPGGVGGGNHRITTGTVNVATCLLTGLKVIVSNWHVLVAQHGRKGDPIYQPGPYDGGTARDTIGHAERWQDVVMIDEGNCLFSRAAVGGLNGVAWLLGSRQRFDRYVLPLPEEANLIDGAVAVAIDQDDLDPRILSLGPVLGTKRAEPQMPVVKEGRTTRITREVVHYTDAEVEVGMGYGQTALFADQCVAPYMSEGGDSGSLVVTPSGDSGALAIRQTPEGNYVVGLLFAGSSTHTIFNRIEHVERLLQVRFGPEPEDAA